MSDASNTTTVRTSAWAERIGEQLVAGMRRFSDSEDTPLWRLQFATSFSQSEQLIMQDAKLADLIKLRTFCDKAIEALKTDGGRRAVEKDAAA